MRTKLTLLSTAAALLILTSAACGDDDDQATAFDAGNPVVCDTLANQPYTYTSTFQFLTGAPEVRPTDVMPGPDTAQFKQEVDGAHEDADSYEGTVVASDYYREYPAIIAVYDDGGAWSSVDGEWEERDLVASPNMIPQRPVNLCAAIAPDVDTTWDSEREDVNGISSHRFDVTDFVSDFPDRSPGVGPTSDISQLVNEFDGSIWVADNGSYITKVDLAGSGTYPDGTVLNVAFVYEITEMDADVDISPPALS
jgi:hypothetical protein